MEDACDCCESARYQMQMAAAPKQAGSIADEQNVPGNICARSSKLSAGCLKTFEMHRACNVARASEDACDCCESAHYQMQMAAAPKQAVSFAGEQKVPADVGAQSQKLWMRCQKPFEKLHACNTSCVSECGCDFCDSFVHN